MKPLGLPEGSVRAILAVGALASAAYMWVSGNAMPEEQKTLVTVAVTYYFAARGASEAAPDVDVDIEKVDLLRQQRETP